MFSELRKMSKSCCSCVPLKLPPSTRSSESLSRVVLVSGTSQQAILHSLAELSLLWRSGSRMTSFVRFLMRLVKFISRENWMPVQREGAKERSRACPLRSRCSLPRTSPSALPAFSVSGWEIIRMFFSYLMQSHPSLKLLEELVN